MLLRGNKYGTAVISDVYEIFSIKEGVDPNFINEIIQCPENLNKILRYRQGCLYGQYRIYAEDFLSVKVKMPSSKEQTLIGKCTSTFDEVIAIKKRKLAT